MNHYRQIMHVVNPAGSRVAPAPKPQPKPVTLTPATQAAVRAAQEQARQRVLAAASRAVKPSPATAAVLRAIGQQRQQPAPVVPRTPAASGGGIFGAVVRSAVQGRGNALPTSPRSPVTGYPSRSASALHGLGDLADLTPAQQAAEYVKRIRDVYIPPTTKRVANQKVFAARVEEVRKKVSAKELALRLMGLNAGLPSNWQANYTAARDRFMRNADEAQLLLNAQKAALEKQLKHPEKAVVALGPLKPLDTTDTIIASLTLAGWGPAKDVAAADYNPDVARPGFGVPVPGTKQAGSTSSSGSSSGSTIDNSGGTVFGPQVGGSGSSGSSSGGSSTPPPAEKPPASKPPAESKAPPSQTNSGGSQQTVGADDPLASLKAVFLGEDGKPTIAAYAAIGLGAYLVISK